MELSPVEARVLQCPECQSLLQGFYVAGRGHDQLKASFSRALAEARRRQPNLACHGCGWSGDLDADVVRALRALIEGMEPV